MVGFHKDDPREGAIVPQNEQTVLSTGLDDLEALLAKPRGFPEATCPRCGDPDDVVTLQLDDVASFGCSCGAEFSAQDVLALVRGWVPVLQWLALWPAKED